MGKGKSTEERIKYFKDMFPIKFNDEITLYLLDEKVDVVIDNQNLRNYYFNVIDNDGYKYRQNVHHILSSRKNYKCPARFFANNPYTYENINNFFKINDIDLFIEGTNLPVSGCAREKFDFVKSNGEIVNTTWNQIQHHTFRYKKDYDEVKQKRFDDTHMTKDKAIPIILKKSEELKRPLLQSDFEGVETTDTSIGIRVIWRIWGTFTNMIKDLGLQEHDGYFRPNDKNYHSHNEVINSVKSVCDKVRTEGRTTVMYPDFKENIDIEISTIRRHCELDGTTLNKLVEKYGCKLQQAGNGLNHTFCDGERIVSKYEYDFSNFLRTYGLNFNVDYFRNIPYKSIDSSYSGKMNCDYLIIFNNKKVYIELAGILGNKGHQEAYRNNTPIKSKSKELYRQKLYQKRDIFERNGFDYYILLPDEMNEETYRNIFNKYLKEVA